VGSQNDKTSKIKDKKTNWHLLSAKHVRHCPRYHPSYPEWCTVIIPFFEKRKWKFRDVEHWLEIIQVASGWGNLAPVTASQQSDSRVHVPVRPPYCWGVLLREWGFRGRPGAPRVWDYDQTSTAMKEFFLACVAHDLFWLLVLLTYCLGFGSFNITFVEHIQCSTFGFHYCPPFL
jgi:hypothetical protein